MSLSERRICLSFLSHVLSMNGDKDASFALKHCCSYISLALLGYQSEQRIIVYPCGNSFKIIFTLLTSQWHGQTLHGGKS